MRATAAILAACMMIASSEVKADAQSDAVALLDLCMSGMDIADIAASADGFDILATDTSERSLELLKPIGIVTTLGGTAIMVEGGVLANPNTSTEWNTRFEQAGLTKDRKWTTTFSSWGDGRFVILGGEGQFATLFETIDITPNVVCAVMRTKPFPAVALPTGATLVGSVDTPHGTTARYRSDNPAVIAAVKPAALLNELYSYSAETYLDTFVQTIAPKR